VDDPRIQLGDREVAAAILAGGQARRFMGRDKSRLVIDGRTIIVRQLDALQRVASELFIVAPDDGRYRDVGVPVYPDVIPASGPLGGLATALERAHAPRVLVVACDLPFLEPPLLEALTDAAREGDGAWARSSRGVEPLVACYRRSARGVVRGAILAGRLALHDLGAVLRLTTIDVEAGAHGWSDRVLANVNTPADYDRLQ
jgi:molybdopterin-guanine dinucleotide biosynthesis protein A